MNDEADLETRGNAGDWLTSAMSRNPEAFLVLAAGAALLLRRTTDVDAYASAAAGYAGRSQRRLARQASRIGKRGARLGRSARSAADHALHEQPLAVAAIGLAAGAAVAAFLPRTEIEDRTFGPARDDLFEAAGRARDRVVGAASEAGSRLKDGAADLAQDAAEGFRDKMEKEDDGVAEPAPASTETGRQARSNIGGGGAGA